MYRDNVRDEQTLVANFVEEQRSHWRAGSDPDRILSIEVPNELVYTKEYHEKVGPLTRRGGIVSAAPGALNSKSDRLQILADVFEMMKLTNTEDFRREAIEAAKNLHYQFPGTRNSSAPE